MPKKAASKKTSSSSSSSTAQSEPAGKGGKRKAETTAAPTGPMHHKKEEGTTVLLNDLYIKYKETDVDRIGPDGVERLCKDLGISPLSLAALILAWQLGASEMGFFQKEEFVQGMSNLKVYDLVALRSAISKLEKEASSNQESFNELYKYAFGFCCDTNNRKSIDIESAASMLELVLPHGPHTKKFSEFLRKASTYKVINKDQWNCFLEFSRNVKADLSNYDNNEAWPLLIDEFVDFLHE